MGIPNALHDTLDWCCWFGTTICAESADGREQNGQLGTWQRVASDVVNASQPKATTSQKNKYN